MTAGGLTAILLTVFLNLTGPRRWRIETAMDMSALDRIKEFLGGFASGKGWSAEAADRLCLVAEETLLILSRLDDDVEADKNAACCWWPGKITGWRNWNLSLPQTRATLRTGWRCSAGRLPKMSSNTRFHSGYCVTSLHRCATSSTAMRISSPSVSRRKQFYPDRLHRVVRYLGNFQCEVVKLQGRARFRHGLKSFQDQAIQGFRPAGR